MVDCLVVAGAFGGRSRSARRRVRAGHAAVCEPFRRHNGSYGEENEMTHLLPSNEHRIDRIVRVAVGLGLLGLTVLGPQTLWGLVGLVPLATGLIGSCPMYSLLGLSTSRSRPA
jgi:hypothetical protein